MEMPHEMTEAPDDAVVDPVLRQRYSFTRRTDERGELLEIQSWVDPGGGVTPHVHPTMDERFTVVSGRAGFLAGHRWTEASAGESVDVPAGTRHAYRNDGDEVAHIMCEARPPQTLEQFLTDTAALSRAGKITRQGLPRGIDGLLAGIALVHGYREMVEIGFPLPPPAVQRALFPPLVRIAERRGYRPGNFEAALEGSNGSG